MSVSSIDDESAVLRRFAKASTITLVCIWCYKQICAPEVYKEFFQSKDILKPSTLVTVKINTYVFYSLGNFYTCHRINRKTFKIWSVARSQHGRSHLWQGHAERPDGQGESGLRGSPWVSLSIYPAKKQNLPALLYCAFPFFWHSLEKVNLGL